MITIKEQRRKQAQTLILEAKMFDANSPSELDGLSPLLALHPRIGIRLSSDALFQQFRAAEQSLVSSATEDDVPQAVVFEYDDEPLGILSFYVTTNKWRKDPMNLYARIDFVIVKDRYRRMGVARALVTCTLLVLTTSYRENLYSVSCLAAHQAIWQILHELNFVERPKEGRNFVHQEWKLGETSCGVPHTQLVREAKSALKAANYRLRQRFGPS